MHGWLLYRNLTGALAILAALGACGTGGDLGETPEPIGDFRLGHVVAFADKAKSTLASRTAEATEIEAAISAAVKERLGRYSGGKFYHISVKVDAYQLAIPGVPIIASPRSAMVLKIGLWDDATATQLNEELHTLAVIEPTTSTTIFGSGYVRDSEQQLEVLAARAAELIESWLKSDVSPIAKLGPLAEIAPEGVPSAPETTDDSGNDDGSELPQEQAEA